jgi:hypothetical protein
MTQPTDAAILARAVALLQSGLLASALPGRLMREFNLSPDRARRLAQQAMESRAKNSYTTNNEPYPK